ncbi:hypothetical protein [Neptuniibacter halophilus]|uniref:hypothetical protein n=1 Tax=Neptuniibacter halophilus TaxID=651666 RepID=UPI002574393F|nr:hypothetical protein [Neptuniibacter halophilus]
MNYRGMQNSLIIGVAASALAACSLQTPRQIHGDVYLIDTELAQLCSPSACYSLNLIQPSWNEQDIARQFGLPMQNYSWNASELTAILLSPPDNSYQVEQLSDHEFIIPRTLATETTYHLLRQEDFFLYWTTPGES